MVKKYIIGTPNNMYLYVGGFWAAKKEDASKFTKKTALEIIEVMKIESEKDDPFYTGKDLRKECSLMEI